MNIDIIFKKLIELGWELVYDNGIDNREWQNMNRFVEFEDNYINIYVYSDETKYGSYLTSEEFELFNLLNQYYN